MLYAARRRDYLMRIIVDAMGGDNAPFEIVKGAYAASLEYDVEIVLVGDTEQIEKLAEENEYDLSKIEIIDTKVAITMEDDPLCVVRAKNDSSMSIALKLLVEGKGDAVVSAGNSGALFTGASLIVRKIRGVKRAAIASVLPFSPPVLLLDSGANLVVTDDCLEQFAVMGSAYMRNYYGIEEPRVGLLNNGAEECKGTELHVTAHQRLKAADNINFVGNVEANMISRDVCDVLVTDGFNGNILLKCTEGMGKLMINELKGLFLASNITKLSALMLKKRIKAIKRKYDSSEHGGAPILGISKPVIKAHGSSNAKAFKNAIRQAIAVVDTGVTYDIAKEAEKFEAKRRAEIAAKHAENGGGNEK